MSDNDTRWNVNQVKRGKLVVQTTIAIWILALVSLVIFYSRLADAVVIVVASLTLMYCLYAGYNWALYTSIPALLFTAARLLEWGDVFSGGTISNQSVVFSINSTIAGVTRTALAFLLVAAAIYFMFSKSGFAFMWYRRELRTRNEKRAVEEYEEKDRVDPRD